LDFAKRAADAEELIRVLEEEKRIYQNTELVNTFDFETLIKMLQDLVDHIPGSKKLPDPGKALATMRKLRTKLEEQQKVAVKFQQQIQVLLREDQQEKLTERIVKGMEYFVKLLKEEVLSPLDDHIASLAGAGKIKKYSKLVQQVRLDVARKINGILEVKFRDVLFTSSAAKVSLEPQIIHQKKKKSDKGSSLNETLAMFKSGLDAPAIASRRDLALSTIEGHIALLIKSGDVAICDCMEEKKLASILDAIRESSESSMLPVKQKLGDAVSYGEIRAVFNHLQFLEKKTL
jgi:uncharacterized protein YpbB